MSENVWSCGLKKKIVVIGAGAAGLASAAELKKLGFHNITILEASNQVGGRVRTMKYSFKALEIGAEWIHGECDNIVYEIAKQHDLIDICAPSYMDSLFELPHISSVEDKKVILDAVKFLDGIMDTLHSYFTATTETQSILSLSEYLKRNFESHFSGSDSEHVRDLKQAVFKWFLKLQCELNGSNAIESVSARLLDKYKECDGLQTVELRYGYSSVLNVFLEQIPAESIILNKIVKLICWSKSLNNIKIICQDGSEFFADHLVITIPLGYLKRKACVMFEPALPYHKMKAIDCTGFGTINKVYLEFKNPFWKPGDIFNVFWTSHLESVHQANKTFRSWCKDINRFAYVFNQPTLLCAWVSGEGALLMEGLTDEQIVFDCHHLLISILCDENLPGPSKVIRSHWNTEPFSCGSYSYLSVSNEVENLGNVELAEPTFKSDEFGEPPCLLFAGEATHPFFYSTVHGAVESGIREARRISAYHKLIRHPIFGDPISSVKKMKVVIIGAGAAGLSCALHLTEHGFKDILLLEALPTIGGRIHTITYENSVLELGAQWIHGENSLYDFCLKYDLLEETKESYEGRGKFCASNGNIIPQHILNEMLTVMEEMRDKVNTHDLNLYESAESIFEQSFQAYLSECDDTAQVKFLKKGVFHWFKRFEIIDNGCDYLHELNALSYRNWVESPGQYHIDFKNGFNSFVKHIVGKLNDVILKSKPVKCVHWQKEVFQSHCYEKFNDQPLHEFPVMIECEDGEFIAAENVVVTSSVGFLKENMESFFQPRLPKLKENALQRIGFGTINKIFLVFEKAFWKEDDKGFQLIWIDDASKEPYCTPQDNWVFGLTGFDRVRNLPNVLLAWVGGVHAKDMEKNDSKSIGITCTRILRQFLDNPDIPFPVQVFSSTWYTNPYIRGSYSYHSNEFLNLNCGIKHLQEPIYCDVTLFSGKTIKWPAVTFAGEAFDAQHFSSVHGAMQSGIAESVRIVEFFRNMQD